MLEYLAELIEDSHDFGWSAVKGTHAILLCKMEEGRVSSDQTHEIDRIRRAYATRVPSLSAVKRRQSKDTLTPCKFYQKGLVCIKQTTRLMAIHIYMYVATALQVIRNTHTRLKIVES